MGEADSDVGVTMMGVAGCWVDMSGGHTTSLCGSGTLRYFLLSGVVQQQVGITLLGCL